MTTEGAAVLVATALLLLLLLLPAAGVLAAAVLLAPDAAAAEVELCAFAPSPIKMIGRRIHGQSPAKRAVRMADDDEWEKS